MKKKPHLGILTRLGGFLYCIPLTSSKPYQLNWNNITEHNYLIYENVKQRELHKNDVYKPLKNDYYKNYWLF